MDLKTDRIKSYFEKMSKKAGITPLELAEGILSVANTSMERAIRVISVERGFDPYEFTLFSFGGAGGMHSMFLARLLNIPKVFIPKNPGILSAMGMVMADIVKDYSQTVMIDKPESGEDGMSKLFAPLEERGFNDLGVEGVKNSDMVMERYLDMRYQGQSYEILVPFTKDYTKEFHGLHEKYYGYSNKDKVVQIVNLRLRAKGFTEKPIFKEEKRSVTRHENEAVLGEKEIFFDGKTFNSIVFLREKLKKGNVVKGPALIVEYSSTTVIPPFATGKVDGYGNIVCDVKC
jgi:N-methylhydantoinase A